jgi:oligopeptide transport system substrate-binding protein
MKKKPPPLFRKGIAVDRPTCLAALSVFTGLHPENYLRLTETAYDEILKKLSQSKTEGAKKKYCTQGIEFLMKDYRLIPLGAYDLSILVKPEFVGWKLNQMNQLDLSDLHVAKTVSK